jgi:hypothetical protein
MPAEDKPKTQAQARGYLDHARLQHGGDGSTNGPRRVPHPKACIKTMPQAPRGTAGVVDQFMRIGVCDLSCK